jgi:DNA (cytosine-5)-methyltransferase 1
MNKVLRFVHRPTSHPRVFTAVSVCSGSGLSDLGYAHAGFRFMVQAESNAYRAQIGKDNFPDSEWVVGDIKETWRDVVDKYKKRARHPLDLLVATPPCQGMSSSNPSRGKRTSRQAKKHEQKNALILAILPIVKELKPRIVVAENVRQLLTLTITHNKKRKTVIEVLRENMKNYSFFKGVVDVADYGIPQGRKRAIIVAIRKDEDCLSGIVRSQKVPWPKATHGSNGDPHVTIGNWLRQMQYDSLDARSPQSAKGTHPLHFVPHYSGDRYLQVSCIPKHSGRSAYENERCPDCGHSPVPAGLVRCNKCACVMRNRPYVFVNRKPRLISGFKSSYRRMNPKRPAATITTNSSHVGSDFKIHPFENRVLSILECADIQTVPRTYKWTRPIMDDKTYTIRNVIGEAFPPFFTFLHGCLLQRLLTFGSRPAVQASRILSMCQPQRQGWPEISV